MKSFTEIEEKENLLSSKDPTNLQNSPVQNDSPIKEESIKIQPKEIRYASIDILRIISCIMVIFTHSFKCLSEYYQTNNINLTQKEFINIKLIPVILFSPCIGIFLLISGFLLLPMKGTLNEFLLKRVKKILGPFVFYFILYNVINYCTGVFDLKTFGLYFAYLFINNTDDLDLTYCHFWYFYMILGIYLFIPIINSFVETAKFNYWIYFIIIASIGLLAGYLKYFYEVTFGEVSNYNITGTFYYFIGTLSYVLLGAFIKIHMKNNNFYLWGALLYIVGIISKIICLFFSDKFINSTIDKWFILGTCIQSVGLFILLRKINIKNKKCCAILEDISNRTYAIYLMHYIILKWINIGLRNLCNNLWMFIPVSLLTFILSYIIAKALSFIPYSSYIFG